jgi:thioredoxin 1
MNTSIYIVIGLLAAFIFLVVRAKKMMKSLPAVEDHKNIITLTDKNFAAQTKNRLMIVDFWAAWCGPCKMMAPVLNEVAEELEGSKRVGKLNVDENSALARKYNVRSIPTMILIRDGKEIGRFVGVKSKNYILDQIKMAETAGN